MLSLSLSLRGKRCGLVPPRLSLSLSLSPSFFQAGPPSTPAPLAQSNAVMFHINARETKVQAAREVLLAGNLTVPNTTARARMLPHACPPARTREVSEVWRTPLHSRSQHSQTFKHHERCLMLPDTGPGGREWRSRFPETLAFQDLFVPVCEQQHSGDPKGTISAMALSEDPPRWQRLRCQRQRLGHRAWQKPTRRREPKFHVGALEKLQLLVAGIACK